MSTDCTGKQGNSKLLMKLQYLFRQLGTKLTKTLKTNFGKILLCLEDTSLTKQQFVVIHTICQYEVPTLLESLAVHKKKYWSLYFHKS